MKIIEKNKINKKNFYLLELINEKYKIALDILAKRYVKVCTITENVNNDKLYEFKELIKKSALDQATKKITNIINDVYKK